MKLLPLYKYKYRCLSKYIIQFNDKHHIYVSRINGLRMWQPWNNEWLDHWEELPKRKV